LIQIPGLVIAGGAASRAGGSKALLPFCGSTLLDAVLARVAPQVSQLALNVPQDSSSIYRTRYPAYPLLFDLYSERVGPLAGVITGLNWAQTLGNAGWLATFPCDTPFLPRDLVPQLMAEADDYPVLAHDGERLQGACAVWPLKCLDQLRLGVEEGKLRSLSSALEAVRGKTCLVAASPFAFFNINTRDDLARAEKLAAEAL
jgi:molybdopterin-guanine dinucleotide biosynthesis protein A